MSDGGTGSTSPTTDKTLKALHSLYVESLPPSERSRMLTLMGDDPGRIMRASEALKTITDSAHLDRLQRWHEVACLCHRRPELADDDEVASAMESAVLKGAPDRADVDNVEVVRSGLRTCLTDEPTPWKTFYATTIENLGEQDPATRAAEFGKPGCNDVADPTGQATIVSRFWTDASLDHLARYVDPRHWKQLGSLYWKEMTPVEGPHLNSTGYTATFKEVVAIPPSNITVYLDVSFSSTATYALTEYRATASSAWRNDDISVDEGCVLATSQTLGPPDLPQLVYSTKTIEFRNDVLNEFSELACDNGWVDLMTKMALPEGRRPAVDPVRDAAPDPLDAWVGSVNQLVRHGARSSKRFVSSVRDGRPSSSMIGDLLRLGDLTVDAYGQGLRATRDIVRQLAEPRARQ